MLVLRVLLLASVAFAGSACSTRPLPQQSTGYDTYTIVSKIRCEMREAIKSYAVGAIRRTNPDIADALASGAIQLNKLDRRRLHRDTQRDLAKYEAALIGYEFTFDITEVNNAKADAGLLRTLTRGPFRIGLSAEHNRSRQNTRNFRVVDRFGDLATLEAERYCQQPAQSSNWAYPIAGRLGLAELVGTFLDLNQSGNLAGPAGKEPVPTFSDTIKFTTKVVGSVNPTITLSPVGDSFQVASAGFKADASREDIHKVVVVLTLPATPKQGPVASRQRALNELDRQQNRELIIQLQNLTE